MQLAIELHRLGLTKKETEVYLALLQTGRAPISLLAKKASITVTNCYHLLESLEVKGYVKQLKGKKAKEYMATDPQSILKSIERLHEIADSIIPDLRNLYVSEKHKPSLRFFEGIDGIQQIYRETLEAKAIDAIGSVQSLEKIDPAFFKKYREQIFKNHVYVRDILPGTQESVAKENKQILKGYYDIAFIPGDKQASPTDILIFGDNVALITLEAPVFGTVITQPYIASTFRMMFNIMWQALR